MREYAGDSTCWIGRVIRVIGINMTWKASEYAPSDAAPRTRPTSTLSRLTFPQEMSEAVKTLALKPPRFLRLTFDYVTGGHQCARDQLSSVEMIEYVTRLATIAHGPYPASATMTATS